MKLIAPQVHKRSATLNTGYELQACIWGASSHILNVPKNEFTVLGT
jgi:hypothetical protein